MCDDLDLRSISARRNLQIREETLKCFHDFYRLTNSRSITSGRNQNCPAASGDLLLFTWICLVFLCARCQLPDVGMPAEAGLKLITSTLWRTLWNQLTVSGCIIEKNDVRALTQCYSWRSVLLKQLFPEPENQHTALFKFMAIIGSLAAHLSSFSSMVENRGGSTELWILALAHI